MRITNNKIAGLVFMLIFVVICCNASAKHLGTYGATFEIEERDFLSVIETKLQYLEETGEIAKLNGRYQAQLKSQIKRPTPVVGIVKADKTLLRKFDPTVYLEEDIEIVDAAGNPSVLHAKGTPINPLNYQPFTSPLLFIDGDDTQQIEYARSIQNRDLSVLVILVSGEPGLKKQEDKEYYYYFDQFGTYAKKFNISKVPSLIFQESQEKILTIKEVNLNEKR